MSLPAAHLAGWLWTAYLAPALIVLVTIAKGQIERVSSDEGAGARAKRKRRTR